MSATLSALEKAKAIAAKLSNGSGVGNIDAKNDTFGDSGVSRKRKRSDADEDGREKNHFDVKQIFSCKMRSRRYIHCHKPQVQLTVH